MESKKMPEVESTGTRREIKEQCEKYGKFVGRGAFYPILVFLLGHICIAEKEIKMCG